MTPEHPNTVRIVELPNGRFKGEAWFKGNLVVQTETIFPNMPNCIMYLNRKIEQYNLFNDRHIPLMNKKGVAFFYVVR